MAMSANGFIARDNDETPWSDEEWESFKQMCKSAGNIIIGRRTYELAVQDGNFPFEGGLNVVCSSKQIENKWGKSAVFVSSQEEAIEILSSKNFKTVMVGGGGNLNSQFIKAGLVDEIYLDVEPVVFGSGIPLFAPVDFEHKLELLEIKKLNNSTIQLHYKVIK